MTSVTKYPYEAISFRTGTKIAFQGEKGAYSEEAVTQFFGNRVTAVPYRSLLEVFSSVEKSKIKYGVVPVENSSEGSVNETYDLLLNSRIMVCGEINLRVKHCLIANTNTKLKNITTVYSHPQALAQCRNFLRKMNVDNIPAYDTAGSVKLIKEKNLDNSAAIASLAASKIYNMNLIAKDIEDNIMNYTRFFILSKCDSPPSGDDKTSIIFSVKHIPGALYRALGALESKHMSMTKIESRPTRQKPWEYNFYMDFKGHRRDKISIEAIQGMERESIFVKVLGSYPKAKVMD